MTADDKDRLAFAYNPYALIELIGFGCLHGIDDVLLYWFTWESAAEEEMYVQKAYTDC